MGLTPAGPSGQTIAVTDSALTQSLLTVLERRYLPGLEELGLVRVQPDANLMANIRFLRILEVAHGADVARSLHALNMQNVISSFRDGSHSLVFVVAGEESHVRVYLGLYKMDPTSHAHTADQIEMLASALHGNFPGIRLAPLSDRDVSMEVLRPIATLAKTGAITGIPSLKSDCRDWSVSPTACAASRIASWWWRSRSPRPTSTMSSSGAAIWAAKSTPTSPARSATPSGRPPRTPTRRADRWVEDSSWAAPPCWAA